MNLLGQLPSSASAGKSLNWIDVQKLLRMLLIQAFGVFVTIGVPWLVNIEFPQLMKLTYVWHGTDFTALVVIGVNMLAETLRRWAAGQQPAQYGQGNTMSGIGGTDIAHYAAGKQLAAQQAALHSLRCEASADRRCFNK